MRKTGHFSQLCSAIRYVSDSGKDRGLRYIEVNNGVLSFTVSVDRCMDITYFRHKGVNLSFLSQNGVAAEGDFSQTFCGGMLYTCGLDSVGVRQGFPVHGSVHGIPAQLTEVAADEKGVRICGYMQDGALFGRDLRLYRTIYTPVNGNAVTVSDRLVNGGAKTENFALMYHMNVGYPMLDDGVRVQCDTEACRGRTPYATQRLADSLRIGLPVEQEEQVFFRTLKKGAVAVVNEKLKKTLRFRYDMEALPCLNQWKCMVEGTYALGIEPSTTFLDDLFTYRAIGPSEEKVFTVVLSAEDR